MRRWGGLRGERGTRPEVMRGYLSLFWPVVCAACILILSCGLFLDLAVVYVGQEQGNGYRRNHVVGMEAYYGRVVFQSRRYVDLSREAATPVQIDINARFNMAELAKGFVYFDAYHKQARGVQQPEVTGVVLPIWVTVAALLIPPLRWWKSRHRQYKAPVEAQTDHVVSVDL